MKHQQIRIFTHLRFCAKMTRLQQIPHKDTIMPTLNWLNRNQAEQTVSNTPYHLLQLEQQYGDNSSNLIIQGDNLQALKALIPLYGGQVKCIFIDPPYNTQSAFEHYDDKLEHAQWLSMMYPRLQLLRELLSEDGSIWITLDDNESHYLKVMCDEIFGRKNFVANVVWQHSIQGKNDAKLFSLHHNHLLIYRKSEAFKRNLLDRESEHNINYKNPDNDPKGAWRAGDFRSPNLRENLKYNVITPSGKVIEPPEKGWRWSEESFYSKVQTGEITFINDETKILRKIYLSDQDGRVPETIWFGKDNGTTREATNEIKAFNSKELFATPKPEKLIAQILKIATNEGDLVLDSFLGSGTTCAVAHKMNRRYIGIEMGEHARTHVIPRLQAVIDGEQGGISKATSWQGGGGFGFYTLGNAVFDSHGDIDHAVKFSDLAHYIWWRKTGTTLPATELSSPYLGTHDGVAYYLLYNGILGDKRPNGGNVLTLGVLKHLLETHPHDGKKIIFGEACRIGENRCLDEAIEFVQMPYHLNF